MNLTKRWPVGVLILGATLWAIPARAGNEAWQDVWQEKQAAQPAATPSSLDWQQRALKRPQTARPTAQRWVSPQRVAQRPTIEQNSPTVDPSTMETIPTPDETATPLQNHPTPAQNRPTPARNHPTAIEGGEVIEPGATQFEPVAPNSVFAENPTVRRRGCASCGQQGEIGRAHV
jgi:hypothetical protein